MYKWQVTIFTETSKGVLKTTSVLAEELIDVSRILMTFNTRKTDVIYKYEVERTMILV